MADELAVPPLPTPLLGELANELRSAATGLATLGASLQRAGEVARRLEQRLADDAVTAPTARAFVERVHGTDDEIRELAERLVGAEQQVNRLMNLYVAAYQLHSTLEPAEVVSVIAEVTINLIGADRFVVLVRSEDGRRLEVAWREPGNGFAGGAFAGEAYAGGDEKVDATLADGRLRLAEGRVPEDGGSAVLAVVPLRFEEQTVGAIVLFSLLEHRPALRPEDRELFDLLSVQAASALFSARLFAAKQRRVSTLESMMRLARGED
jgi:GAF domain-containing protein